jgi:hypothetical protein
VAIDVKVVVAVRNRIIKVNGKKPDGPQEEPSFPAKY